MTIIYDVKESILKRKQFDVNSITISKELKYELCSLWVNVAS